MGHGIAGADNRGFIWRDGTLVDLGSPGGAVTLPWAMNEAGAIVGRSQVNATQWHAFVWRDGSMTDIGGPGPFSEAEAIDAHGNVAGQTGYGRPFLWRDGTLVVIGDNGMAIDMNDRCQVVGTGSPVGSRPRAVLWMPS